MSYEYYNPSMSDYMDRMPPNNEDPQGCLWQMLILAFMAAILVAVYML